MAYIDGFVTPVPADRKQEYAAYAAEWWPRFRDLGALSMAEAWGDDVPPGKQTDFPRAVALEPGEVVVFSWLVWPDRATRDAAHAAIASNPDLAESMARMPFDGRRMIFGGFAALFHQEVDQ